MQKHAQKPPSRICAVSRALVLIMKILTILLAITISGNAFSKCSHRDYDKNGNLIDYPETIFGGCSYLVPTLRTGVVLGQSLYWGAGILVPFHQNFDNEGGYINRGLVANVTFYNDQKIFDLGIGSHAGYLIFPGKSWEFGMSTDGESYGGYLGVSFIGTLRIRYVGGDTSKVWTEIGLRY